MGIRALVTGATGFIGSNLTKELINRGFEVFVLIRNESTIGTGRVDKINGVKKIKANVKELIDMNKELPQFDVCFNLASYGVDYRQQEMDGIISGNIEFTLDLINFCHENKTKRLIHTGSCFEYGINEEELLTEDHIVRPQSIYGAAKASSVIMANTYAKLKDVSLITLRPFGIFGENEGLHKLIPQLINAALNNEKLDLTAGMQVRDYLYIKDLVDAYIQVALHEDLKAYEIFNVCSSEKTTIKRLADLICEISKCNSDIFNFGSLPYRQNEVFHFVGSNTKIKRCVNWKPKYTLQEGLEETYKWYKDYLEDNND